MGWNKNNDDNQNFFKWNTQFHATLNDREIEQINYDIFDAWKFFRELNW